MTYTANYTVETTAKSFEIVEYLRQHGRTGVSELSDALGITKSIVHNHVSTLRELGYVRKRRGKYQLSLRFLETGVDVRAQSELFQQIEQKLPVLAKQFGTVAVLVEHDDAAGVVTAVHDESAGADAALGLGERVALEDDPIGRAVLAELPEEAGHDAVAVGDGESRSHEAVAGEWSVFTASLDGASSPTVVAAGVTVADHVGAVGVQLPQSADDETERSIRNAVVSLSKSFSTTQSYDRSFATTKHSWFSE